MIGLSTYAFFWQRHASAPAPISWKAMLERTAELGCSLFQFCDYPELEAMSTEEARDVARYADALGIQLEFGTRGLAPEHIKRFLALCGAAGVTLLRSMVKAEESDQALELLRALTPELERTGVRLSLETYEQIRVSRLVELVRETDSEYVGICLDPGNSVAALDAPETTIRECAPYVNNLHIKDFAFSRRDGWVGFTYAGARLGEGLLDLDGMLAAVQPDANNINQIIEHWLVWQGDSASTCRLEDEWTQHSLEYLQNHLKGTQS